MNTDRIRERLAAWFEANKRDLPWRHTTDGYRVWLSEVILQQTRVDQGWAYYERFVREYPDVQSLAAADERAVMRLWQGLGYYSRARNLHAAAQQVVSQMGGVFPRSYEQIIRLRGVGPYTAAAISSIAYNEAVAAVDGNVYRVLSRLYDVDTPIDTGAGQQLFGQLARDLLDTQHPGRHNQAMMELGALQCVPKTPDCSRCPIADECLSLRNETVGIRPVKQAKTRVIDRYFNYFMLTHQQTFPIIQRTTDDIWKHLYELPMIETDGRLHDAESIWQDPQLKQWLKTSARAVLSHTTPTIVHHLTHQRIHACMFCIELSHDACISDAVYIRPEQVDDYAISRLMQQLLER
ncbi:MAG: A/G-specific adenine glycosylase [Paludibacteraceae bacterium]|nr:A/G-specific adenine glycosylase [Paludibacteraceae bacterium]